MTQFNSINTTPRSKNFEVNKEFLKQFKTNMSQIANEKPSGLNNSFYNIDRLQRRRNSPDRKQPTKYENGFYTSLNRVSSKSKKREKQFFDTSVLSMDLKSLNEEL